MLKTCKRGHCEEAYVNKRGVSECRKCRSERVTAWRERNIDKAREQNKVYMRKKRATEPEKMAEQLSKWFDANPTKRTEYSRRWREKNPTKVREIRSNYKARKRTTSIGKINIEQLLEAYNSICGVCKKQISEKYHIDHIMPLSKGGKHTQDLAHSSRLSVKERPNFSFNLL